MDRGTHAHTHRERDRERGASRIREERGRAWGFSGLQVAGCSLASDIDALGWAEQGKVRKGIRRWSVVSGLSKGVGWLVSYSQDMLLLPLTPPPPPHHHLRSGREFTGDQSLIDRNSQMFGTERLNWIHYLTDYPRSMDACNAAGKSPPRSVLLNSFPPPPLSSRTLCCIFSPPTSLRPLRSPSQPTSRPLRRLFPSSSFFHPTSS